MSTHVRARVQITVELSVGSAWGPGVTADQVRRQAIEDATEALRRGLLIHGFRSSLSMASLPPIPAVIVGEPKVVAVLADLEAKS